MGYSIPKFRVLSFNPNANALQCFRVGFAVEVFEKLGMDFDFSIIAGFQFSIVCCGGSLL
jgi:hypothetical protein